MRFGMSKVAGSRCFTADFHSPSAYRFDDILESLQAHIFEGRVDLASDLPIGVVRHAYAARIRNAFQPCSNIDTVAEDVVVIDDDVADMNADAKFDPPVQRYAVVLRGHG